MAMEIRTVIEGAHDGKVLCTAYNKAKNELYTGGEDHLIKAWSCRTGELMGTMRGHKGWVTCLVYIPQLKYIVSGSVDGTIVVWTDSHLEVQVVEFSGGVFCLAYSPRKSYVIAGGNATFAIYKAGTVNMRQLIRYHNRQRLIKSERSRQRSAPILDDSADVTFKALDTTNRGMMQFKGTESGHSDVIKTILTTPNGRFITAGFDHRIVMWDVEKLKESRPFVPAHTAAITQLNLDSFSNYILSSSFDGTVRSWNMEGRCLDTFEVLGDAREISACYAAAVKQYWICSRNKVLSYDPRSPANITNFTSEFSQLSDYDICHLSSAEDNDIVVGVSRYNEVVIWRYNPMAPHRTMIGHTSSLDPSAGWVEHLLVVRMNSSSGGEHIFTASNDGAVLHWCLDEEQHTDVYVVEESFNGHEGSVLCLVWIQEYMAVLSGGDDCTIRIWYLNRQDRTFGDQVLPTEMTGHEERVTGMVLVPGQVVISISHDKTIRRWDLKSMTPMGMIDNAHDHGLTCIDYCSETNHIATTGGEPVAKIWDADQLTLVAVLDGHKHEVTQVCWADFKGRWVTVSDDDTIRLWDKEGVQTQCFDYNGDSGLKMYVDNVNKRLLLACMDRIIRLYDLQEPHPIMKYEGHNDTIRCLGYVEEFGWYVSGAWDKTIRTWLSEAKQNKFSPLANRKEKAADTMPEFQETDEVDERYRSSYERKHPLVPPKTLKLGSGSLTVLRTMGLGKKSKKALGSDNLYDMYRQDDDSPVSTTGLGAKLAELEHRLNPPDHHDYDY